MKFLFLLGLLSLVNVRGDTPGVCYYEDVRGTWVFSESERTFDHTIPCDSVGTIVYTKNITLDFPNTATDELGNTGTWTMIRSQGFEVNINERSYFAYSYYEGDFSNSVSYCDRTLPGWSRDKTIRNWACFSGTKTTPVPPRPLQKAAGQKQLNQKYRNDLQMIEKINSAQSAWTAKAYPEFEKYTLAEMSLRAGGPSISSSDDRVTPAPASEELKAKVAMFPTNFDWRDVNGVNYVSPVRDQASCGGCFAFSAMGTLEARIRIATQNQRQDVFSTQDVLECSNLSQGCSGGFNYLIAGRYSQDQGVVAESCNPYTGIDGPCNTDPACTRTYVSEYKYVGGYYGACNEEEMLNTLLTEGPFPVGFLVYADFYLYNGGVYFHTDIKSDFNPHEPTSHAVLIVGYGFDEASGLKYWTVKNSWGDSWGQDGYFQILRGSDECSIESNAVTVSVIP